MAAADEAVEELDGDGAVIGVVTRAEMRRRNLRHRAMYVIVVSGGPRLLVHRRAGWKDMWPSRWDVAFGGVAAVGEEPPATARRELLEEAGLEGPLRRLGAGAYEDGEVRVRGDVFVTRSEGPFRFADGEVVETAWVAREELDAWLEAHATTPDSVEIALPLLRGSGLWT